MTRPDPSVMVKPRSVFFTKGFQFEMVMRPASVLNVDCRAQVASEGMNRERDNDTALFAGLAAGHVAPIQAARSVRRLRSRRRAALEGLEGGASFSLHSSAAIRPREERI